MICKKNPQSRASGGARLGRSIIQYLTHKGPEVNAIYLDGKADALTHPKSYPFRSYLFRNVSPGLFKHFLASDYDAYVIIGFGGLTVALLVIWLRFRSKIALLLPLWHHTYMFHTPVAKCVFHLKRMVVDFPILRLAACPIICQSDYERRSLANFAKRIALIPYGIDIREPMWADYSGIRKLRRSHSSELRIVTSGRLTAGKIPLHFLRVIDRLRRKRPVRFQILAARIDRKYLRRFISEIQRLHLNEVVDIVDVSGWSRTKVFALLTQGDVAVCPSHSEAFGIAAVEYAYSGIPVVATRTGIVEYLENKNCLIAANWGDIEGLVSAILRIDHMSPHERESMSHTARHIIKTELTDERFLAMLWKTLQREFRDGQR